MKFFYHLKAFYKNKGCIGNFIRNKLYVAKIIVIKDTIAVVGHRTFNIMA